MYWSWQCCQLCGLETAPLQKPFIPSQLRFLSRSSAPLPFSELPSMSVFQSYERDDLRGSVWTDGHCSRQVDRRTMMRQCVQPLCEPAHASSIHRQLDPFFLH